MASFALSNYIRVDIMPVTKMAVIEMALDANRLAQRNQIRVNQLKFWILIEWFDVMNLEIFLGVTPLAIWLLLQVSPSDGRPLRRTLWLTERCEPLLEK